MDPITFRKGCDSGPDRQKKKLKEIITMKSLILAQDER